MIYLASYALSVLFAHFAARTKRRSNFIVFSIISIAITVALAGLRDYSIGIDTQNYLTMERFWAGAVKRESLLAYIKYYMSLGLGEYLFVLLLGIVEHYTGSFSAFLFVAHAVIITGVYVGAFRMKKHAAPELTLLLFYLLYYGSTLNITRQYMAMAILFAVAADIEGGKHLRYLFFTLIAFFVHKTSIIGLAPLLLYLVLYPRNPLKDYSTVSRKTIAFIAVVGGTVLFVPTARLAIELGLLSRKYLNYFNGEVSSSYILELLFLTVEAVAMVVLWKSFRKYNARADFYVFCLIAFIALVLLGRNLNYGKRIASYFSFHNIIAIGMLVNGQQLRSNRRIVQLGVILVVLVYWVYVYVLWNASQTIPYVSIFG